MRRRDFLRQSALAAAALALPGSAPRTLFAHPAGALAVRPRAAVRVRGRVTAAGKGIDGVAVSDGVSVAITRDDGHYTLIADSSRPFVFLSVPAGFRTPVGPRGTAAFYHRLSPNASDEMLAPFELLPLPDGDDAHAFLVLADTQTQDMYEVERLHAETVPDVRATARTLGDLPAFGIACGDIMFDDLSLYPEYERAVKAMGIPFFQVIGNHDLVYDSGSDEESATVFERHFGPTYYSFDRGAVHYVVLDDVFWYGRGGGGFGYLGYIDQRQQDWLRADLARIERGRTVVVFLHIPVLSTRSARNGNARVTPNESMTNRDALYEILEPYDTYILSGHTHEHERHADGGVRHHVHGTVCGAWWSGDICWDGTPNGYAVYEVRGSELRWRYKATGKPADHQMRVYPRGADPALPNDVVANVWDADPAWSVAWYEDGQRRGLMSRRLGLDPLAVEQHTGPDLPPRRKWVEPTMTEHLYHAAVSPAAREIVVEATDPWGNVYREAMRRAP